MTRATNEKIGNGHSATGRIITVKVEFNEEKKRLEQAKDFEFEEDKARTNTLEYKNEGSDAANEKKRKHIEDHVQKHKKEPHPLILLSMSAGDQIRWVGPDGGFEVKVSKDNSLRDGESKAPDNPFGWAEVWRSDGGTGELVSGPVLKGAVGELIVKQGQYKYSLRTKNRGTLDPNIYVCL
ncbi:MAG TPA: hypothetical protein VE422_22215 [Terriglobia bacterium]|nr:hypothetical protein [Terriglobia bacterium]